MDKETADKTRAMVRRVTLKNVNDSGETQRASVEVANGIWRDDVEIHQPYGFSANPPEDGGLAIAFAVGGDEGDLVVFPAGNPSKRMGGLPPGGVGIYNLHGDSIVLTPDGSVFVKSGGPVTIEAGGPVIIEATDITLRANVRVEGTLHTTGNITSDAPDGDDE